VTVTFQKANRQSVKIKLGLQGPSGAGKTLGALAMASALASGGKVAVIDTENGSASLYGDRFDFDTLNLAPPYTSARYIEAITAAVEAGYRVIVLDSISHQWVGEGGILSRKEELDARGGNIYTNWAKFTKEHESFKAAILNADAHIIATLRAKQDYVVEQNAQGKTAPRKVGLAPVQREGMEYEFSIVFELQMDHKAMVSKDRTGLFESGVAYDLAKPDVVKRLSGWLASGAQPAAVPQGAPTTVANAGAVTLPGTPEKLGGHGGKRIDQLTTDELLDVRKKLEGKKPYAATLATIDAHLKATEAVTE
jgi:hypothetical protein